MPKADRARGAPSGSPRDGHLISPSSSEDTASSPVCRSPPQTGVNVRGLPTEENAPDQSGAFLAAKLGRVAATFWRNSRASFWLDAPTADDSTGASSPASRRSAGASSPASRRSGSGARPQPNSALFSEWLRRKTSLAADPRAPIDKRQHVGMRDRGPFAADSTSDHEPRSFLREMDAYSVHIFASQGSSAQEVADKLWRLEAADAACTRALRSDALPSPRNEAPVYVKRADARMRLAGALMASTGALEYYVGVADDCTSALAICPGLAAAHLQRGRASLALACSPFAEEGEVMMICLPPQSPPSPTAADTAHSAHSQHCCHTALPPREWPVHGVRRRSGYVPAGGGGARGQKLALPGPHKKYRLQQTTNMSPLLRLITTYTPISVTALSMLRRAAAACAAKSWRCPAAGLAALQRPHIKYRLQ